jgi:hypothetical protein
VTACAFPAYFCLAENGFEGRIGKPSTAGRDVRPRTAAKTKTPPVTAGF